MEPVETKTNHKSEVKGKYERYSGVCDVISPEEAHAMANELRKYRKDPDRKIMIGVMAGHFSMRPKEGGPDAEEERAAFPTRDEIAQGFTDDPDVLNTVHFADLYRPREIQTLLEDLELVIQYGGKHLHAIQLDVTWPNPAEIEEFKTRHPKVLMILQIGQFAFDEADNDHQKIVAMIYLSWQKLSARTSFYWIGDCLQVSKKADLTRFPRRGARKALPPDLFPILTGWH